MTGVHILKNDQFFTTLSLIQYVAYFSLLFQLAKERRKKEQAREQDKEHKCITSSFDRGVWPRLLISLA